MPLIDSDHRSQATNPALSFIVQAPAGSGKTEILTQRYLRLLSTVNNPEQIVALTFTRKAASEMRERIVIALQQAAASTEAQTAHQKMTLEFAKEALNRCKQLQWDLLAQPNRLKIITIDALCQSINQAIPLLEKQITYSQITDKPSTHYLNAARQCIQFAIATPEYQQAIKILLLHVDNRQEHLLELFKSLLAQRDQWLTLLFQARSQEKATFEEALRLIEAHELSRFKQSLPFTLAAELTRLASELATIENNPESPRYLLRDWSDFNDLNQDIAIALSKLILGSDHALRKSFDHHVGLKKGSCPDSQYKRLKDASAELLIQLGDFPNFVNALLQVTHLPKPEYDREQWDMLQALFLILPLLVGHLHLLFSEHNEVDFTAISQQALTALGDADNPTDLALYLDNTIHHLLVDEFQDTSINQFEVITKLVQGWQPDDGKTLFVVGDPMQSIYRFRQAEVGLFFRAQEQGIGPVILQPLELRCNFRSTATIVNWVNQQFSKIFPKQFDIESGAVSFHPSVNVISNAENSSIQALSFKNQQQEAAHLIELVKQELHAHPQQSIAILVRSRTHLAQIIRLLRQHQISYQGTDIDLLAHLTHLRDIWSLTQALLTPGNRLAWLAMLRSPYCGMTLEDIHKIAQFNKKKSIYFALLNLDQIQLSDDGRQRALFFLNVMQASLAKRYSQRLSDWVAHTLQALHIENILNESQLDDLEQLWNLLDRYELDGRLPAMKEFLAELNSLYSQQATPSRLQIMTIHKSKGLEFDTVFLPGLGAQPNRGAAPMWRWLTLPTNTHDSILLISPIKGAHRESCPIYNYLDTLDTEKSSFEAQRLLYVAVTRARSRLYLLNSSAKSFKGSFSNLLCNQEFVAMGNDENDEELSITLPDLYQLPAKFYVPSSASTPTYLNSITGIATNNARLTGIVAHKVLQWICDHHPQQVKQIPWQIAYHEYKTLGFDTEQQALALEHLQAQITNLFADKTGAWIISPHDSEHNEFELLVEHNNNLVTRIIDRTFIDNNILWIVDFKTGKEDVASLTQHQQQLNEYAYYLSSSTTLPIHCGLYYLNNCHWVSWNYVANTVEARSTPWFEEIGI